MKKINNRILLLILYIVIIFLIYEILKFIFIKPLIYIGMAIALTMAIFSTLIVINDNHKKRNFIIIITFIVISLIISLSLDKFYTYLNNLNKNEITYKISLYSKNNTGINSINDCTDLNVGILNSNNKVQTKLIDKVKMEIENNKFIEYTDIDSLITDLNQNNIDLIIIPSNLINMLGDTTNYIEITNKEETKIEYSTSNGKNLKDSFTLLIMGVDSEGDNNISSSSNSDTLIIISFNPKTLNATMLSIPRDSYVPITCFKNKRENKITHASWYGEECVEDTIENFLNIDIDYYVKINFKGVVQLVDSLGGVYVDVPRDLCTDDSNRENETCIKKGYQLLNGEEALTLARNRYDLPNGDFDRMKNQQLLLTSLLDSIKKIDSITKIMNILDNLSNSLETNININNIESLLDIYMDINKLTTYNKTPIKFTKLVLTGEAEIIYDEISKINHWNYILNNDSVSMVTNEINNNIKNNNLIKEFNFNITENYQTKIVGNSNTKTTLYTLLPNFIGKDKDTVQDFANKYNIKLKINYKNDNLNNNNTVISQNYHEKTRIDKIDTLEVNIATNNNNSSNNNNNNTSNTIPNLIGKEKNEAIAILEKLNIKYKFNEVSSILYPGVKINYVISQSEKAGESCKNVKELELTIVTQ